MATELIDAKTLARSAPDLQGCIERALNLVPRPRETPAAERGEPLYDHFVGDLRSEVATLVGDEETYKIQGSAGKGQWSTTPWAGVFDLSVTDSATRGHYIVYLFRRDGARIYLSLNQGTTAVYATQKRHYKRALEAKASEYSALLGLESGGDLLVGPIDLGGGPEPLTPGYEVGNVAAIAYDRRAVPDNGRLAADLRRMLDLYSLLTERIDRVEDGADHTQARDPADLEEERRMRWHRRFEGRNRRAAQRAKHLQGYRCQGCEVDYVALYGEVGKRCVDAHHLVPFAELGEGRRRLDPLRDFAIVCATCHRLIHSRRPQPLSIAELRGMLGRSSEG